jgi:hypothetical protein
MSTIYSSVSGEADDAKLTEYFDIQRAAGLMWEDIASSLNLSLSTITRTRRRIRYVDDCKSTRNTSVIADSVSYSMNCKNAVTVVFVGEKNDDKLFKNSKRRRTNVDGHCIRS